MTQERSLYWIALVALGLMACGSASDESVDPSETGQDPNPEDTMADGDTSTLDRDAVFDELPTIDPAEGFRVDQGEFVLQPGDEITYCVRIPIPDDFAGRDLALIGWDWDLPQYTHHFFMAYRDEPLDADGPVPCDGVDARFPMAVANPEDAMGTSLGQEGAPKLLFGAGVGVDRYLGTEEYGRVMRSGGHLVTNHHVLNTGAEPVTLAASFNMYVRDLETVPHPVNQLNCVTTDVAMAPQSQREVTATCTVPFDLDLVLLASHAHNHLTRFETRIFDGTETQPKVIYESDDWDSPDLVWQDEPVHLEQGQGLTFTCYFDNPFDTEVAYGFGIENEMCATMNAYTYPEGQEYEVPPSLGTIITSNEAGTCLGLDDTGNIVESDDCTVLDTENLPIEIPFF